MNSRLYSTTAAQKSRKSALFTKRETKIKQTNIPVELDLGIEKRLQDKNQLKSELAARNLHNFDVDKLVRCELCFKYDKGIVPLKYMYYFNYFNTMKNLNRY